MQWTGIQIQAGEMQQVLATIKRKRWKQFKEMIAAIRGAILLLFMDSKKLEIV